jgi:diguanylate cyclase (GGDEF)-like protein
MEDGFSFRRESDVASTDEKTGLANRRRFFDKIERLLADRADDPAPFVIARVGLDGFKPVNDLYGREAGDSILQQVGMRLRAAVDEHGTVARYSGDEFAVLYPMVFRREDAKAHGEMLSEILAAPYDLGERTARLSASVGLSLFEDADETVEELLRKADSALYHARRRGAGRTLVHSREMEEAAKRLTRIEQALRRAVSAEEVEPFFQPIVDLKTRETVGFECLARWTDADLGFVSPAVFIPIAEETGIIVPLTQLLLRKATMAAAGWPRHMFLSFNLSPVQLEDPNTGKAVLSILRKTGFDPKRLEIEITETGVMSDPVTAEAIVDDLRSAGVRVSLDDFGTGQSSLGRLREFKFDKLKIDRAFVSSILNDRPSEHIVKAILAMCDGLGISTIAEGIEEEGQADKLIQFGCSGGQGYLYGKPVDADATLGYLNDAFRGASRASNG